MEGNKDEALKCLAIAQRHRDAGNYAAARRFCEKSLALFSTPEAVRLAAIVKSESAASSSSPASSPGPSQAESTGAETHPSQGKTRHRVPATDSTNGGPSSDRKREYTAEHAAIVKRVRACRITEYYEILAVGKDCDESDVKKAYRRLALQLHPDKNGAPGADEAFKMVSKAFQILSDPQKRAAFDQHGADPDSRSSGVSAGRSGFAGGPQRFEGELSPEDLFNMFFGGGGPQFGGSPFGPGGTGFSVNFGPGGFTQFNTNRRPRQQAVPNDPGTVFKQLLPLLIIVFISLLSSLPSLLDAFRPADPTFSFVPSEYYAQQRFTSARNVPYYVNPGQFTRHSIWESIPVGERDNPRAGGSSKQLGTFESTVESSYIQALQHECRLEEDNRERRLSARIGVFGLGTNWDEVERIRGEKLPSCERLMKLSDQSQ